MMIRRHLGPDKELEGSCNVIMEEVEKLKEDMARMRSQGKGILARLTCSKFIERITNNHFATKFRALTMAEYHEGQDSMKHDDGNFVLKKSADDSTGGVTEQILWQSFDSPTDCFLPGMKLGINLKTGQNWSLTSWLTDSIPTPGAFTLNWVPKERQLILRRRGEISLFYYYYFFDSRLIVDTLDCNLQFF
ncbi:hypothetical protein LWI29_000892 [Acer saccharum]|uniref:Bulb-type lectin domain-containing protein n=1 Tax=Acer saccharum TaxID=4024 RepID=A0AA39SZ17_ACESA|nr:hypothetical protein LWI29_000892 [Acer saccharum]